eukprot:121294-Chlamydomonas_euryale.AAC.2
MLTCMMKPCRPTQLVAGRSRSGGGCQHRCQEGCSAAAPPAWQAAVGSRSPHARRGGGGDGGGAVPPVPWRFTPNFTPSLWSAWSPCVQESGCSDAGRVAAWMRAADCVKRILVAACLDIGTRSAACMRAGVAAARMGSHVPMPAWQRHMSVARMRRRRGT